MSPLFEIIHRNCPSTLKTSTPVAPPLPAPPTLVPPSGPSLIDFLELLRDIDQDGSTLRCLDCVCALRLTCRALRNYIDTTAPLRVRCPGGDVQAFCTTSRHNWASNLQNIVLGALYGANADAVDVSTFASLSLPALRSLRVESLQLRYAWRLAEGAWPRLTTLTLSLRDRQPGRDTLGMLGGIGAFSRACWPLEELNIRLEGPRFMPAELEAAVAAGVAAAFAPTLRRLQVVGTVAGGDVLAALREHACGRGRIVWQVVEEGEEKSWPQLTVVGLVAAAAAAVGGRGACGGVEENVRTVTVE